MAENSEKACIFCEIVAGRAHSHKIYEDDLTLSILDINPFSRGHSLVIPNRHVPWWHELTAEENASLFRVAKIVLQCSGAIPGVAAKVSRSARTPVHGRDGRIDSKSPHQGGKRIRKRNKLSTGLSVIPNSGLLDAQAFFRSVHIPIRWLPSIVSGGLWRYPCIPHIDVGGCIGSIATSPVY
jgi:hypothetical protein